MREKNPWKRQRIFWTGSVGIFLVVGLLSGCGKEMAAGHGTAPDTGMAADAEPVPGSDSGTYRIIVDDLAVIMLDRDRDSAAFDQALEAVADYLENPEQPDFDAAMAVLDGTTEQLTAELEGIVPYELEDSLTELLEQYDVDPEEYQVNADMRAVLLSDYISGLEDLKNELDLADLIGSDWGMESLEFWADYYTRYQENLRNYGYYTVNYWFAQRSEEETGYVKEQLLDKLVSLKTETSIWENDRDAVERKLNLCLDGIEALGHEMEAHIGEVQEEVYELDSQRKKVP